MTARRPVRPKRVAPRKAPASAAPADLFSHAVPVEPPPAAKAYAQALEEAGVRAAAKPRPFRLTPERPKERAEMGAMVALLNVAVVDGWCVHVANEGLWSFLDAAIPDKKERGKVIGKLRHAMAKDGFVPRFPDKVLFWKFPARWRAILEAAGERVPAEMACAGAMESKRRGWTPEGDKHWRENPDQHRVLEALRRAGVPFAVVRDGDEAVAAAHAMGAPVRGRFLQDAGLGEQRSDVADPQEA